MAKAQVRVRLAATVTAAVIGCRGVPQRIGRLLGSADTFQCHREVDQCGPLKTHTGEFTCQRD
jgi:hypothetical protein